MVKSATYLLADDGSRGPAVDVDCAPQPGVLRGRHAQLPAELRSLFEARMSAARSREKTAPVRAYCVVVSIRSQIFS